MRLTVQLPVMVAVGYGPGRNRTHYDVGHLPLETMVHAVRRVRMLDGEFDIARVDVDAFIPDQYRRQIEAPRSRWKSDEILRATAWVQGNRKTLAPFLDSGDAEWSGEQLDAGAPK